MRHTLLTLTIAALLLACNQNSTDKKESDRDEKATLQNDPAAAVKPGSSQQRPDSTAAPVALIINPQEANGDLGQITFTQNDKTIFYYRPQSKKGSIRINGVDYTLNQYRYDPQSYSYTLSGSQVRISAKNGKFGEMESDCAYGKFAVVTVTMGNASVKLNMVEVQDCPNP